jgi:LacI family transcriptional regulator
VLLSKYVRPPLTTVHLPAYDLGKSAGEMILKIIRRESLPALRLLLPTDLVIRRSTARLK